MRFSLMCPVNRKTRWITEILAELCLFWAQPQTYKGSENFERAILLYLWKYDMWECRDNAILILSQWHFFDFFFLFYFCCFTKKATESGNKKWHFKVIFPSSVHLLYWGLDFFFFCIWFWEKFDLFPSFLKYIFIFISMCIGILSTWESVWGYRIHWN